MIDPFIEELEFLKLKAECSKDDPIILAYILGQIKKLHYREEEKMTTETRDYIQRHVDRMIKEVPGLIAKKKLELKDELSRNREHSTHIRSGDNKEKADSGKPEESVYHSERWDGPGRSSRPSR